MLNTKYIFDIETNSLHSIEGRITCISLMETSTNKIKSFYGESEIKILTDFWEKINGSLEIIGYNIVFDLPFIIQRTIINNVPVCSNYHIIKTTDLRLISTAFFRVYSRAVKGTLDHWSNHFFGKNKETIGEEMIELYEKRDWEAIKKHCEEDIKITNELYKRIVNCGLIKN